MSTESIIERHDSFMTLNYPRFPIAFVKGAGCDLFDAEGKRYLDLFSGFGAGALGHCHPAIVDEVTKQANQLWHVGNLLHTEPQTRLAQHIAEKGFGGRSYFCHSGSDANEAAFKLARLYGQGKRYKAVSTTNSFHGRGFAAMMATGQEKVRHGFAPYVDGFSSVPYNDLDAMRAAVDDETVLIVVEPIQGEGGMNVPDDDYLTGLRELCDQKDLLLMFDEVWTGCGRTGKYFAYQHWPVEPDILTLGKAVGMGLALGVMCAGDRAAHLFDTRDYGGVAHATTLGGNCLTTAVSARMFEVIESEGLLARATSLGDSIMDRMRGSHPAVVDVRGKGLFIGIELAKGCDANAVAKTCLDRGVLINATQGTVLRLAPPMIVSDAEVDEGLAVMNQAIAELCDGAGA